MSVWPVIIGYRDQKGMTWYERLYVNQATQTLAETSAELLQADFAALTNAAYLSGGGVLQQSPLSPALPAATTYGSGADKAVLVYADALGNMHRYRIPAPLSSLFASDGVTVLSGGLVSGLTTQLIAQNGCGASGTYIQRFVGGYRVRGRLPRRLSVIHRSALLTEQQ